MTSFCFFNSKSAVNFNFKPDLSQLVGTTIFDYRTWDHQKGMINTLIKENKLSGNFFKGQTFIGLDFSGMNLRGKDFSDCKFYKVNLSDCDLTEVTFRNTTFKMCNLVEAILYYPFDDKGNPSVEKSFKVLHKNSGDLIRQYSKLMDEKEEKEKNGFHQEAEEIKKQARCLNNLFVRLDEKWSSSCINNLNLKGINLSGINLEGVYLAGTQLNGATLKNVNLNFADLRKINLSNSTLKSVSFKGANLGNANFTNAVLENTNFSFSIIKYMKLKLYEENFLLNIQQIIFKKDRIDPDYLKEELIMLHDNCKDNKAKALLKILLESKEIDFINDY